MNLSPREREVLSYVSEGYTDDQIAYILVIAPCTVRDHLREARIKLDAANRTHAVKKALLAGLSLTAPPLRPAKTLKIEG